MGRSLSQRQAVTKTIATRYKRADKTAVIWHNDRIGATIRRSTTAYDH